MNMTALDQLLDHASNACHLRLTTPVEAWKRFVMLQTVRSLPLTPEGFIGVMHELSPAKNLSNEAFNRLERDLLGVSSELF